ncbi:MAG: NAD(+) diphosphatase [Bacteroidaceae bacterium]|nr:NAD(+) diphosphatase [Bacteroidaceae bacterium]
MSQHLFYIFNNERLLIRQTNNSYTIYSGEECPDFVQCTSLHLFTEHEGTQCYVGSTTDEELPEGYQWIGLRESYHLLPSYLYQEAGKAAEIRYFDTHHRYCGLCGGAMAWHTPISKRCTECNDEIWPQLNTAIIVLVRRGEEALLVKAKNFRRNYYGLVAGFVETGESLEECVRREVREETGIEITNIRYFASQPWPYPMGLMVGFNADYVSGDIRLIDGELRDAAFFTRDNLPAIPEKLSMARMLIDNWVEGNA